MLERNPNIIEFDLCKDGYLYKINAINSHLGIFVRELDGFIILREKFRSRYLFVELHLDRDSHYGTVTPLEELEFYGEIPPGFKEYTSKDTIKSHDKIRDHMFAYLDKKLKEYPDERTW